MCKHQCQSNTLSNASLEDLLSELSRRYNTPVRHLGTAGLLYLKKSADYNHSEGQSLEKYFPFGSLSFAQMIHTKSMRIMSISQKEQSGKETNFESLQDSALDMINYSMFLAEHCSKSQPNPMFIQEL